jgi:hypothetical protein
MSFLSSLSDLFLGGGASGIISGGISIYGKLKEKKLDNEHERNKWSYEIQMTRANMEHESLLADKELLVSQQVGADALRLAAIEAESQFGNTSDWVNNIRSLHRLVLTYVLIIGAFAMNWTSGADVSEQQILLTIFVTNAAASAVGFWFGDRVIAAAGPSRAAM